MVRGRVVPMGTVTTTFLDPAKLKVDEGMNAIRIDPGSDCPDERLRLWARISERGCFLHLDINPLFSADLSDKEKVRICIRDDCVEIIASGGSDEGNPFGPQFNCLVRAVVISPKVRDRMTYCKIKYRGFQ